MAAPGPDRKLERWLKVQIAVFNRRIMPARVIAVTGSSAKSTTTLLLGHILASRHEVLCQAGHNGLSHSVRALSRMKRRHHYAVIETGAGEPGDLKRICDLVQPDVSVITMVALEHKSSFKTVEAVQREKSQLARSLRAGGLAVLNADDPRVLAMQHQCSGRWVTFGCDNADATYRTTDVRCTLPERLQLTLKWNGQSLPLRTRFAGRHFWLPTAAAAATALELGVPPDLVAEPRGLVRTRS